MTDRRRPNLPDALLFAAALLLFIVAGLVLTPVIAAYLYVNEMRRV